MYHKIKQLADEALALQNKDRMDAALREISALCDPEVQQQLADSKALASAPSGFVASPAVKAMKGGGKNA